MRKTRHHHPCRPQSTREHRLAHRAGCVAEAFIAVETGSRREPMDLLGYAERVVALEAAWDRLLRDLAV